jgi:hypothetical protein
MEGTVYHSHLLVHLLFFSIHIYLYHPVMFSVDHTVLLLLIPVLIYSQSDKKIKKEGELFFMKFKTCMAYLHVQHEQSQK